MEEAHPEAAALLAAAGWAPHDGWNVFTRGTLVMGFQPDGMAFHVKNWAAIREGHPQWTADTPDTAEEAAQWLADRYEAAQTLAHESDSESSETRAEEEPGSDNAHEPDSSGDGSDGSFELAASEPLDSPLAPVSEKVENLQDESNGETGEEASARVGDLDGDGEAGGVLSEEPSVELGPALVKGGSEFEAPEDAAIYADFTIDDLGGPDETLELPAPDPEDFAPEDFVHDPEPEAPQDRFIGLDDLDRVRSLRIGDVATEALRLTTMIEQAVSEQEGEFSNIQAYVVSNLDKHTGAFTPQDDASRATYGRFLELSSARSKIALIDARRKDATALLIAAGRDEVVSFDVQAAFA